MELVFYGKFGFSRPSLEGNKPTNGKCLVRMKCLSGDPKVVNFFRY